MPIRLDCRADDFAARFGVFLAAKREAAADVEQAVRGIIAEVMARGDAALVEFTRKFDRSDVDAGGLRVTPQEIDRAVAACEPRARDALAFARDRIEAYHRRIAGERRSRGCRNKLSAIKRSRRVSPTSVARCWWAPPQPAACLI